MSLWTKFRHTVEQPLKSVAKLPFIQPIADVAAIATGNPELIPLINAGLTYANTGSLGQGALAGGEALAGQELAGGFGIGSGNSIFNNALGITTTPASMGLPDIGSGLSQAFQSVNPFGSGTPSLSNTINPGIGQGFDVNGDSVASNSPDATSFGTSGPGQMSGLGLGQALAGTNPQGGTVGSIAGSTASTGTLGQLAKLLPLLLAGGQLASGYNQNKDNSMTQAKTAAQQQAQNTQNTANWNMTLNSPPLNRQINPAIAGQNWNNYGYGPEQQFFTNNQLSPGSYTGQAPPGYTPPASIPGATSLATGGRIQALRSTAKKMAIGGEVIPGISSPNPRAQVSSRRSEMMPNKGPTFDSNDPQFGVRVRRLAKGGKSFPRKNGKISGPGGPTDDKIKAMLSNGEYVIKHKSVSHLGGGDNDLGADTLDKINNGEPGFLQQLGEVVRNGGQKEVSNSQPMAKGGHVGNMLKKEKLIALRAMTYALRMSGNPNFHVQLNQATNGGAI